MLVNECCSDCYLVRQVNNYRKGSACVPWRSLGKEWERNFLFFFGRFKVIKSSIKSDYVHWYFFNLVQCVVSSRMLTIVTYYVAHDDGCGELIIIIEADFFLFFA